MLWVLTATPLHADVYLALGQDLGAAFHFFRVFIFIVVKFTKHKIYHFKVH